MEIVIVILIVLAAGAYLAGFIAGVSALGGREQSQSLAGLCDWCGLGLHTLAIVMSISAALAAGRMPLTGIDLALWVISWGTLVFIVISNVRFDIFFSLLYLLPLTVILLVIGLLLGGGPPAPMLKDVGPSLLFPLHILFLYCSMGILLAAVAISLIYLRQQSALQKKPLNKLYARMPALETLDRVHASALRWGFILLLLGVITGLRLAHHKWEGTWSRDPSVLFTLLTVSWYGGLLLIRQLWGLRGRKAAYLTTIGFLLLVFTFVGIIYWFPRGKHPFLERPERKQPATQSTTQLDSGVKVANLESTP